MYILAFMLLVSLSACVEGSTTKPLTPTEVQVVTQVVAKRLIAPKLKDAASKLTVIHGLSAAKVALETTSPAELLKNLGDFLGPENKDISDLIIVLVNERVDLKQIPEIQGKAYIWAVLSGIEGGLA